MRSSLTAALLLLASPCMAGDWAPALSEFMPLESATGRLDRSAAGAATRQSVAVAYAPAPPISQVAVLAVGSTQAGGWEYMTSAGQLSTVLDHGGSVLRVVVRQIGYGGTPVASLWGTALSRDAQYDTERLCATPGGISKECLPGQTIVGWLYYFNLDGQHDGEFAFHNTSLNAPFNTARTSIRIR